MRRCERGRRSVQKLRQQRVILEPRDGPVVGDDVKRVRRGNGKRGHGRPGGVFDVNQVEEPGRISGYRLALFHERAAHNSTWAIQAGESQDDRIDSAAVVFRPFVQALLGFEADLARFRAWIRSGFFIDPLARRLAVDSG